MADKSIRHKIKEDIESALSTYIIAGADYHNTIGTILDRLKLPNELNPEDFPAAFVIAGNETKRDHDVDSLQNQLEIVVTGYVKRESDEDDLNLLTDNFIQDIERAISQDRRRGSIGAINTLPQRIDSDKGTTEPYGLFDFTFLVIYNQDYGNP